jgi:hypothetical protein
MSRPFYAKFPGKCGKCGTCSNPIAVGERIVRATKGYAHAACAKTAKRQLPVVGHTGAQRDPELARMNAEYEAGLADGERYMSDVKLYGRELAEEWEMDAEMARYNRGEDY